jgi:opacity protein-like surface antigen
MLNMTRMSSLDRNHRSSLQGCTVAMALLLWSAGPVHSETQPPSAADQPLKSSRRAEQPGFYARLGVGLDDPEQSRYRDDNCSSTNPPALFGCVKVADERPLGARGSFDSTVVVDTAIGYRFIPWLRAEALLSWRPSMDFNGQSNFIGAGAPQPVWGSVSSLAGFGVAYVDLPPIGPVQPFLGAGLGELLVEGSAVGGEPMLVVAELSTLAGRCAVPGHDREELYFLRASGNRGGERLTRGVVHRVEGSACP